MLGLLVSFVEARDSLGNRPALRDNPRDHTPPLRVIIPANEQVKRAIVRQVIARFAIHGLLSNEDHRITSMEWPGGFSFDPSGRSLCPTKVAPEITNEPCSHIGARIRADPIVIDSLHEIKSTSSRRSCEMLCRSFLQGFDKLNRWSHEFLAQRLRNGDPVPHGGAPILVARLNHQNRNSTRPLRGVAIFDLLGLSVSPFEPQQPEEDCSDDY